MVTIAKMGTRKIEQGPVGRRVAERVRGHRENRGFSLGTLSSRLAAYGRPILPSGLNKIEQGHRRVDVDDLVALAAALETTPSELLDPELSMTASGHTASDGSAILTGGREHQTEMASDHALGTDSITVERSTSWEADSDPLLSLNTSLSNRLEETTQLLQEMRALVIEQRRLTPAIAMSSTSTLSITGPARSTPVGAD